jgi:acetyltransferase
MDRIKAFFSPKSVAVVGSADKEGSVPRVIVDHLIEGKDFHKIAVVGAKEKVYDIPLYNRVSEMPEIPDLVEIVQRADLVPDTVLDCAKAGVKSIIIISAGFKEIGEEGKKREERVLEIAREYGIRIIGPNCIGTIRPSAKLNSTFYDKIPRAGNITFISQSGALGTAVLDWAVSKDIGFSAFVSVGSMSDVDFGDLIDYFGTDPETKSIIIYMEAIGSFLKNAKKFMSAARGFARNKPIVILKPGKFPESTKAAMSHTGSMVGEDSYYDAVFDRAGVVRVEEIADLFDCATILNTALLPKDPRVAIVTNAGGPGVLATDAILARNGVLAKISDGAMAELNKVLPPTWSHGNPIDVIGDATPQRFSSAIQITMKEQGIGGTIVIYVPTSLSSPAEVAKEIARISVKATKPILGVLMGGDDATKARQVLMDAKIPAYEFPEAAVKTYQYMYKYAHNLENLYETPEDLPVHVGTPRNYLKTMVHNAMKKRRFLLTEEESKKLLMAYHIDSTIPRLARNVDEAINCAIEVGFPVVMKIASHDISHKSDVGGVILNLDTQDSVKKAFQKMMETVHQTNPTARIDGVTIQKMITQADYELIVGSKKDATLGPVIMFGLGGTSAEFFKDVSVGLPPLNQILARSIIQKTKTYTMLSDGFRNKPPVNLFMLDEVLIKVSNMIIDFPEIKELDINPLVVTKNGVIALDARIVLDEKPSDKGENHDHLIIQPYPSKYIELWKTHDGRSVTLRPIRPEDELMEKALLAGLSKETQRLRFFHPIKDLTHEMLTRFCNIDYDREMAFVAEAEDPDGKRKIVGVARLILTGDQQQGEYAVVNADDWQGVGLGLKLSDKIIGFAREKSVKNIYAITLSDNSRMLNLGKKLAFTTKSLPEGEVELSLDMT